jgi:hypothetical protein
MVLEVLKDPKVLNLLFASVVLVAGLALYWFHPEIFHQHTFTEKAFEFWVMKWMLFVVTWGLLTAGTDLRFVLAALDLNSVIGLGLVIALWKGDSYDERHTIVNLMFLFGLLFSWNFLARSLIGPGMVWIFPSMTTSLIYISSLAIVIAARYRSAGILFVIASVGYLLLQLPTYRVVFIDNVKGDPELVKWLAFAKLLYGTLFYGAFLSTIQRFESLRLPSLPTANARVRRMTSAVATAVGGGVLTELTLWGGKQVWFLITGHPAH